MLVLNIVNGRLVMILYHMGLCINKAGSDSEDYVIKARERKNVPVSQTLILGSLIKKAGSHQLYNILFAIGHL